MSCFAAEEKEVRAGYGTCPESLTPAAAEPGPEREPAHHAASESLSSFRSPGAPGTRPPWCAEEEMGSAG